jgi:hypothetical protein
VSASWHKAAKQAKNLAGKTFRKDLDALPTIAAIHRTFSGFQVKPYRTTFEQ